MMRSKPTIPKAPGSSFGQIAGRQFLRNPLAVGGLAVVVFMASVAVYAPLLTGDKPLALRAAFPSRYDEDYAAFLDSHYTLVESDLDTPPERTNRFIGYVDRSLTAMTGQLDGEERDRLHSLRVRYLRAARDKDPDSRTELEEIGEAVLEGFEVEKVTLHPQLTFPAIRSLGAAEVFFIAFHLLGVALFLARPVWRWRPRMLLAAAGAALLAAVFWRALVPAFEDPVRYRALIEQLESDAFVLLPPVFFGENENITADSKQPPTWTLPESERHRHRHFHWLGTDTNGRDVLARMIYGARISMSIGIVAVSIYVSIGIVLGSLAGYFRGWVDILISRLIEVMICFPVLFLILIVLAFLRPNIFTIMVVLGITSWTGIARLQRGEFLRLVDQDFVHAVRALGGSNARIIFRHILPNGIGPILVSASFGIAGAILTETALSFLGFGVPPPTASWGDLLYNGRNDIQGTWWLTIFPGAAIFITVTAFNLIGEGLRDAIDPRLRN